MPFVQNYDAEPETSAAIESLMQDREAGLAKLRALAEAGYPHAILNLGLYLGEDSWSTEAEDWLLRAAAFESADAAWNLAMFANHRGDANGVKTWIDRAAEWGEDDAQRVRALDYDVDAFLTGLRNTGA